MRLSMSKVKEPIRFDFVLAIIILIMMIMSLVTIYSAFELIYLNNPSSILINQIRWFMISIAAIGVMMYLGNDSMYSFAKIAYWILLGALIILFLDRFIILRFIGRDLPLVLTINGATSWFQFPGFGSFQPSEFIKIALLIICAGIIDEHNQDKLEDSFMEDLQLFKKILIWVVPPIFFILLQPDTGVVLIIFISIIVMLMCSGIKKEWIFLGLLLIALFLITFFGLYFFNFSLLQKLFGDNSLYKLQRITGWLSPHKYSSSSGFQLMNALMVLGSAGLMGHGPMKNFVAIPEAQTDFIFASLGQSFGFIGTALVVILCIALDIHLCKIAMRSKNMFEKYFICGFIGMLVYQQVQNIGMILGLLPITGITLPFISYGGSSFLSYTIAIGIIFNASNHSPKDLPINHVNPLIR